MQQVTDPTRNTLWQIFSVPTWLALASAVGLVVALLGDGPLDLASWLMLSLPALTTAWALRYRKIPAT